MNFYLMYLPNKALCSSASSTSEEDVGTRQAFRVCLPAIGLSLHEVVIVFELLGVDRSHGAVWNWAHTWQRGNLTRLCRRRSASPLTRTKSRMLEWRRSSTRRWTRSLYCCLDQTCLAVGPNPQRRSSTGSPRNMISPTLSFSFLPIARSSTLDVVTRPSLITPGWSPSRAQAVASTRTLRSRCRFSPLVSKCKNRSTVYLLSASFCFDIEPPHSSLSIELTSIAILPYLL